MEDRSRSSILDPRKAILNRLDDRELVADRGVDLIRPAHRKYFWRLSHTGKPAHERRRDRVGGWRIAFD
jgi:hypothetical protein